MENLEVTIIPEDFKNAPMGYHHNFLSDPQAGCVLWQALRRLYPTSTLEVGTRTVSIDEKYYSINNSVWGTLFMEGKYGPSKINELSEKAKESLLDIPTVQLTLFSNPKNQRHS